MSYRMTAILAVLLASSSAASAQLTPADSAALVANMRALMDAVTKGDSAVWSPHLSARWFLTDEEGRHVTREEFLGAMRPLPPGQSGVLTLTSWHLAHTPDVVVMSSTVDEKHDLYGQHLETRFRVTDTYIRERGRWMQLASQVTALPAPIPGRRISPRILAAYEGTYMLAPEIEMRIVQRDSGLVLVRRDGTEEPLYALDERSFIRHGARGFWVFERGDAGGIERLVNWRDNNAVAWRRR